MWRFAQGCGTRSGSECSADHDALGMIGTIAFVRAASELGHSINQLFGDSFSVAATGPSA